MPRPVPRFDEGRTVRITLWGVAYKWLVQRDLMEQTMYGIADFLKMTPVGSVSRRIGEGVSAGVIIQESHFFIHTWPESGSARVILDSCKDFNPGEAAIWLKTVLEAKHFKVEDMPGARAQIYPRGKSHT